MMAQVRRAPLMGAIVAALALITVLSAVGWGVVGDTNGPDESGSDTRMLAAVLAVARHSDALAAIGSVETNMTMTRDTVIAGRAAIADRKSHLEEQLSTLAGGRYAARVENIRQQVAVLTSNVDRIEAGRPDLLRALLTHEAERLELRDTVTRKLSVALAESADNQSYYMRTGRSESRADSTDSLDEAELLRYQHMDSLSRSVALGSVLLQTAQRLADPTLVTTVEESFESAARRAGRSMEFLSDDGGPDLDGSVIPLAERFFRTGADTVSYFVEIRARLAMAVAERELIASNQGILDKLHSEIDGLVEDIEQNAASETDSSDRSASTARGVLLGIAVLGLIATLAAARHLLSGGARPR